MTILPAVAMLAGALPADAASAADPSLRFGADSVPASWNYESEYLTTLPSDDRWWEGFDDPVLVSLIEEGEKNSFQLSAVARRVEMARRSWEMAKSGWYPSLGLSAGWTGAQSSGAMTSHETPAVRSSYFSLGLNFSWEIDVFGRVREQSKEGKASYNASKAEYSAAMISLSANIATAYVNLRLAQARIELARAQIESQEKISAIAQARFETGLSSKLDVAQALTLLYTTRASLPGLENQETSAINSIALLIGAWPEEIADRLRAPRELPNPFRLVNLGVPADLLRRRPDIVEAEYQLAAYAAQAGIARKDFLPVLSLDGSIGTSAHEGRDLFAKNSLTYSVAPTLSWTVFEGFSRSNKVAYAKEQMLAGIDSYNLAVMNAVIETRDALGSYATALRQIDLMRKVCDESREAFTLALDRYKRGLSAFNDVMSAQITVLDNEDSLIQTRASALTALIKVYGAVAGAPDAK